MQNVSMLANVHTSLRIPRSKLFLYMNRTYIRVRDETDTVVTSLHKQLAYNSDDSFVDVGY